MAKILLVEDEQDLAGAVREWLVEDNHSVQILDNGLSALKELQSGQWDLAILDIMLPDKSGLEVCREYRRQNGSCPILILTALKSLDSKEAGLDAGADDYLVKPFHLRELSARIRALLRRTQNKTAMVLTISNICLDSLACTVRKDGKEIHLLPKEFSLLEFLMRHPNQVFSAEALIDKVWGSNTEIVSDTVRSYIKTLRKKIDSKDSPSLIATVHGIGYKIETQ